MAQPQSFREYAREKARSARPTSLTLSAAFAYLEELVELAVGYAVVRVNRTTDNLTKAVGTEVGEVDAKVAALEARIAALEAKGTEQ